MQHDTAANLNPAELAQRQRHEGYLRLLSIFHYIVAGIAALMSLFFLIYIVLGFLMLVNPEGMAGSGDPPPRFAGCFFLGFGGVAIAAAWGYAIFTALAGRWLTKRRRYAACLVAAGLSCLFTPFGTVLGIFAIVVLVQPGVRALFDTEASAVAEESA